MITVFSIYLLNNKNKTLFNTRAYLVIILYTILYKNVAYILLT